MATVFKSKVDPRQHFYICMCSLFDSLGGILTVADDLLQNDGRKFLDMMEKLAERRLQKEEEVSEQAEEYLDEVDEDDDEVYEDEEEEV